MRSTNRVIIASKKMETTLDMASKSLFEFVPALKLIRMQMKISKKNNNRRRNIILLTFWVAESTLTSVRPLRFGYLRLVT